MQAVDFNRLKEGEVDLGVSSYSSEAEPTGTSFERD